MHNSPASRATQAQSDTDRCTELRDSLRRSLDLVRRAGGPVPYDLRARIAACEADLMEACFDNMPI